MSSFSTSQESNISPKSNAGFFDYVLMCGLLAIVAVPYMVIHVFLGLGGIAAPLIFRNTNFSYWRAEARWGVFILVGALVAAVLVAPSYAAVTLFEMFVDWAVTNPTYMDLVTRYL